MIFENGTFAVTLGSLLLDVFEANMGPFLVLFLLISLSHSQQSYAIFNADLPMLNGLFDLVSVYNYDFESKLLREFIKPSMNQRDVALNRYYKYIGYTGYYNYYLVLWSQKEIGNAQNQNCWMLINDVGVIDDGRYFGYEVLIKEGKTMIIPHNVDTTIRSQRSINSLNSKMNASSHFAVHQKSQNTIQNLSFQIEENEARFDELLARNKRLQQELESKNRMSFVYIIIIATICGICVILFIVVIFVCISGKSGKTKMRKTDALVAIDTRHQIKIAQHIKQRDNVKNKGKRDLTAMGRFEPERFSDALDNLPAVQDAVIEGIVNEMETDEGGNKNSPIVWCD